MSKVKYPDQKVMQMEIQNIIDQSGIFNETDQSADTAQTFKPVRSKKIVFQTLVTLSSAAAVLILVFIGIQTGKSTGPKSITPLSVVTDETESSNGDGDNPDQSKADENKAIEDVTKETVDFSKISISNIEFLTDDIEVQYRKVRSVSNGNDYQIPCIYYKKNQITEVSDFFSNKISDVENDSKLKILSVVSQLSKNGTVKYPIRISSSCAVMPGITDTNPKVVSITQTNSINYGDGESAIRDVSEFAYNFDLNQGELITINDLFDNYEQGLAEAYNYLTPIINSIYEKMDQNSIIVNKWNAADLFRDGNWYFDNDGIRVCFNDSDIKLSTKNDLNSYNLSTTVLWIPFDDLPSLKAEYKK